MSRAKTRRPGTRSDKRAASVAGPGFIRPRRPASPLAIPDDLPDAAEAALDDLLAASEHPRSLTMPEITSQEELDDGEPVADAVELPRKKPPPAPGAKRAKSVVAELAAAPAARVKPRRMTSDARGPVDDDAGERASLDDDDVDLAELAAAPAARVTPRRMTSDSSALDEVVGDLPQQSDNGAGDRIDNSASGRIAIDDDEVVDEHVLPEIEPLEFAVHETGEHLASLQGAIAAAGHVVAVGGAGQAGLAKLNAAFAERDFDVLVVALPGGEPLIDAALALEPRRPIVIATGAGNAPDVIQRALVAGADLALARPHDVESCAPVLLAAVRLHAERRIAQNARGAEAVLRAKLEEISDPDPRGLQPFEVFQRELELELKRARRFEYPLSVALFAVEVPPPPPPAGIRGILRARAGNAIIHTIRDIDLATQLDHERFLVLLPYTDLTGAAKLGRRVIAAVAEGDPVVSAGRSFVPRVVGAVSSARPDQQLSFAKLLKDAQRALDGARRDGAELAVQP